MVKKYHEDYSLLEKELADDYTQEELEEKELEEQLSIGVK